MQVVLLNNHLKPNENTASTRELQQTFSVLRKHVTHY